MGREKSPHKKWLYGVGGEDTMGTEGKRLLRSFACRNRIKLKLNFSRDGKRL
jgi:hypothetical protein